MRKQRCDIFIYHTYIFDLSYFIVNCWSIDSNVLVGDYVMFAGCYVMLCSQKDKFEENFKELTKWVDVKSSKFGTLTVLREKRLSRLGTALKVNKLTHVYQIFQMHQEKLYVMIIWLKKQIDNNCPGTWWVFFFFFLVLDELIQNENESANRKLYELKLGLLEELGWSHLVTYEKQWMQVRFPTSLPLF